MTITGYSITPKENLDTTMKAITYTEYGSPEVLHMSEIEKPTPKENEVLIKVHAAAANPLDWRKMRADPFLVRLSDGFLRPKETRLGADVAGRVEAVGAAVTRFRPGDEVFGERGVAGFAEYIAMPEECLAHKPANISFEEAAAVPVAALTALQALRDHGQIKAGQKLLINGASGGIGTYAVQMGKVFGAEVTGVCSTRNLELVRSLGADHVIDYTREDFTQNGRHYDLILDNVANHSVTKCLQALNPQAICVVAGFKTIGRLLYTVTLGSWRAKANGQQVKIFNAQINSKDLMLLASWLESGQIKSVIDNCYPLNQTAEALSYLEKGHARGKVIISIC